MKKNGKKKPSVKVNDMRSKKNPKGGVVIKETIVSSRMDKTLASPATSRLDDKYPTSPLANKTIKIS